MRWYFWRHLPSVAFWGAKVVEISPERCSIMLPFSGRTKNPFRSIYFAAQAGAAELSSGLLAALAVHGEPPVSMLVTQFEMEFIKKATAPGYFSCEQGAEIFQAVRQTLQSGEATSVDAVCIARMPDGTEVSRSKIHWSFKRKENKR